MRCRTASVRRPRALGGRRLAGISRGWAAAYWLGRRSFPRGPVGGTHHPFARPRRRRHRSVFDPPAPRRLAARDRRVSSSLDLRPRLTGHRGRTRDTVGPSGRSARRACGGAVDVRRSGASLEVRAFVIAPLQRLLAASRAVVGTGATGPRLRSRFGVCSARHPRAHRTDPCRCGLRPCGFTLTTLRVRRGGLVRGGRRPRACRPLCHGPSGSAPLRESARERRGSDPR